MFCTQERLISLSHPQMFPTYPKNLQNNILLFKTVAIAERQRSTFSRVYAYGVASIFFFHITINICMTIGLAPVIGIPLPLISYGGSSLLTFTILLFILIRLDADRQMILR